MSTDSKIDVLDSGYVAYVEHWGNEERIIEAARMSTDKGFQGWEGKSCDKCDGAGAVRNTICWKCNGHGMLEGDTKLLRYLYTHKHFTPFEMAGLIIEVQAPIMVFREWHRHRTQSYNEMSGRYTELPDLYYLPSLERLKAAKQSQTNKQGSTDGFSEEDAKEIQDLLRTSYTCSRRDYEALLKAGVSREVARLILPVNQYSRMRASANLRNWLAFLELRQAEGAQWEIRKYADAVARLVGQHFPRTYGLYKETDAG